jgi:hypothetical protein
MIVLHRCIEVGLWGVAVHDLQASGRSHCLTLHKGALKEVKEVHRRLVGVLLRSQRVGTVRGVETCWPSRLIAATFLQYSFLSLSTCLCLARLAGISSMEN